MSPAPVPQDTPHLTAGFWPFAHSSPAVTEAQQDPELVHIRVDFAYRLSRAVHVTATGLLRATRVTPHDQGGRVLRTGRHPWRGAGFSSVYSGSPNTPLLTASFAVRYMA
ncbi:hypothetical protein ACH4C2_36620 [Streptomyces sp. NPDC018057]|uniref:hypothetical protein n=1 Tax=unclassified Streptomyces TaxID=2593676 RepID=UPI0037950146